MRAAQERQLPGALILHAKNFGLLSNLAHDIADGGLLMGIRAQKCDEQVTLPVDGALTINQVPITRAIKLH